MERLPNDILRIIADILPIRGAARMMRVNRNMYSRRPHVLMHTLMRKEKMHIKSPEFDWVDGTVEKVVCVKKDYSWVDSRATDIIVQVIRTGSMYTTPMLNNRTRYYVHQICDRIGLNAVSTGPTRKKAGPDVYPTCCCYLQISPDCDCDSRPIPCKNWRAMNISNTIKRSLEYGAIF